MKIYKYRIPFESGFGVKQTEVIVDIQRNAKVLSVGYQRGEGIVMWAAVDPKQDILSLPFYVFGTGMELPLPAVNGRWVYIGTVQLPDGYVWHIYDGRAGRG